MTDTPATPAPAPLPNIDDVQKMSPSQAAAKVAELGAQEQFRNKLLAGDGKTVKLFQELAKQRSQTEIAESLIAAAADPNVPLPPGGGANHNGLSRRDEIEATRWLLDDGATPLELAEWEVGEAMLSPADFHTLERQFNSQCMANPQWVQKLLSGDPTARLMLDRFKRIAVTSRPLPPMPTTGIAR